MSESNKIVVRTTIKTITTVKQGDKTVTTEKIETSEDENFDLANAEMTKVMGYADSLAAWMQGMPRWPR